MNKFQTIEACAMTEALRSRMVLLAKTAECAKALAERMAFGGEVARSAAPLAQCSARCSAGRRGLQSGRPHQVVCERVPE